MLGLNRFSASLKDLFMGLDDLLIVENISQMDGFLQGIDPCVRLLTLSFLIVTSLFASSPIQFLMLYAPIPFLALTSKASLGGFFKRNLLVPLPAVMTGVPAIFMTGGDPIWTTHLGTMLISVTIEGLQRFIIFSSRIWVTYGCLSLFVLVSGIDGVLSTLTTLKVPPILVQLFALTYRYIYLSIHECVRVIIAIEARTTQHTRRLSLNNLRSLTGVISVLLLRSIDRSERVYLAMKARGFSLNNTAYTPINIQIYDLFFFLLSAIYSTLIILWVN